MGGRHPFDRLRQPAEVWIVRHGQSAGNHERRVQGHTDLPLTDQGRDQARATGRWFRNRGVNLVLASPLIRARETAFIIAREAGLDPDAIVDTPLLKELDTGIFSGKTFDEIERAHVDAWHAFRRKSWEAVPGAESMAALAHRAADFWELVVDQANGGAGRILCVTHGGFFQWLFRASFDASWNAWMPLVDQKNCGISHISLSPLPEVPVGEDHRFHAEWRSINHTVW